MLIKALMPEFMLKICVTNKETVTSDTFPLY